MKQKIFRAALCAAVAAITVLAVIPIQYSPAEGINDKLNHILAFYALALLADFSVPETGFKLYKILPLFFYGVSIECVQYFIPYREFSLFDIIADAIGLLVYGITRPSLKYLPLLRSRWDVPEIH